MSILDEILTHKRREIAGLDIRLLRAATETAPPPMDFLAAVSSRPPSGDRRRHPRLIAELKRASPSRGALAPKLDLTAVADVYANNGAAAISVLTDQKYFLGSLETLRQLRGGQGLGIPLLRKDFIISEEQVYETRASGADAVLLIVAALPDDKQLAALYRCALELGLTPLVEVHDAGQLNRALKLKGIRLIGINNRDLETFKVSLEITERLRPMIPEDIAVVAESGIVDRSDVERMRRAGVDAILVGEALITSSDIGAKVRELVGHQEGIAASSPEVDGRP